MSSKNESSDEDVSHEGSILTQSTEDFGGTRSSTSLRVTQLCITYPMSLLSKRIVFDNLKALYNPRELVVVEEKHEDGSPHLHVYIRFNGRTYVKHADLDICGGKHGDYKLINDSIGGKEGWLQYLSKEDRSPVQYGIDMKIHIDMFFHYYFLFFCHRRNPLFVNKQGLI